MLYRVSLAFNELAGERKSEKRRRSKREFFELFTRYYKERENARISVHINFPLFCNEIFTNLRQLTEALWLILFSHSHRALRYTESKILIKTEFLFIPLLLLLRERGEKKKKLRESERVCLCLYNNVLDEKRIALAQKSLYFLLRTHYAYIPHTLALFQSFVTATWQLYRDTKKKSIQVMK